MKTYQRHILSFLKAPIFVLFFLMLVLGLNLSEAQAQVTCGNPQCSSDADCQSAPFTICPPCFFCDIPVGAGTGTCQPSDPLCDDGNACTSDSCEFDSINGIIGCLHEPLALDPLLPDDLPIECYICEPTENGVTVDNGVCDRGPGENCTNSVDCEATGETCIFPNSPTTASGCTDMTSGPTLNAACADGDVCTEDQCDFSGGIGVCQNPERSCESFFFDGCCPTGCVGPTTPGQCPGSTVGTNCDLDCWPPQVCGDGFVQPPETCDDTADLGDAGINPNTGAAVTNTECRDPGSTDECTYCGDNIIQTASGEECDGIDVGICGTAGCDTTTCLCIVEDLLIQGSGPPGGPCSLNPHATGDPIKGGLSLLSLGLALVLLVGLRKRLG